MQPLPSPSPAIAPVRVGESMRGGVASSELPAPNRFLLAYRGHPRQWQDSQLIDVLVKLGEGHSFAGACELAGIPRRTAYYLIQQVPDFAQAVAQIKASDGADWYEEAIRGIVTGTVKPGATGAAVVGLKLRGRGHLLGNGASEAPTGVMVETVVQTATATIRQRYTMVRGPAPANIPAAVGEGEGSMRGEGDGIAALAAQVRAQQLAQLTAGEGEAKA